MDNRIFLKFFTMCCLYSLAEAKKYTDDYCWRDYDGTIPPDALRVSLPNKNQKSTYIGQTLYENKIIPGKLYENDDKIYFEYYSVEYSTSDNVKILCSQHPNKFEWIPTRNVDVRQLTDKILIKGGFESTCSVYIGRVVTNEGFIPGKVICCTETDCYGLYTTNNGTGTLHTDFQILSYNKNLAGTENRVCKQITIALYN